MAVITFSRQFGSGGDAIAARVAELLNYAIFDKTMMAKMAAEVGLSAQEVVDFSETDYRSQGLLDRLLGRTKNVGEIRTWTEDIQGVRRPEKARISEDRAIALVRGVIAAAYKRGDVVIVGRGGQAILKDYSGVLHVRVEAPLAHRMEAVMERTDVTATQAEMASRTRIARPRAMSSASTTSTRPIRSITTWWSIPACWIERAWPR